MFLAFHPTRPALPGEEGPVPPDWIRYIAPWSKAVYKNSDFGSSLIQEMGNVDFGIFIWTLDIKESICLYPAATKPTIAFRFIISGKITCELLYVPIGFNETWFEPGFYEWIYIELQP